MGRISAKVGPASTDIVATDCEEPNQCVFIRGYKISLGEKIWKKLKKTAADFNQGIAIHITISFSGQLRQSK
jgi:hypothetical protein